MQTSIRFRLTAFALVTCAACATDDERARLDGTDAGADGRPRGDDAGASDPHSGTAGHAGGDPIAIGTSVNGSRPDGGVAPGSGPDPDPDAEPDPDDDGPGAPEECTPKVDPGLFARALCSCDDVTFGGYLRTRSFSAVAPMAVAKGASVGINDALVSGSYVDVGGSLRVTGATAFAGYLRVGGDLELAQKLTLPGYLDVAQDAWFESDVWVADVTVGGDLFTQAGTVQPPPWTRVGGSWTHVVFALDPPCACGAGDLLDIDALVADGMAHNDNAAVGLDPNAFQGHVGHRRWVVPPGRFSLSSISGTGDLTLVVDAPTELYVTGDVSITGKFSIEIGPAGDLALFIKGDLAQIGYGTLGDPTRPSRLRVYVGGNGDVSFLGYQPVSANLYAPRSRVVSAGFIDMNGSLFVRDLDAGAYVDITYDRDVLTPGAHCVPLP